MNSKDYSEYLIKKFGSELSIKQLERGFEAWQIKNKAPQIHDLEACDRSINFSQNTLNHINETLRSNR